MSSSTTTSIIKSRMELLQLYKRLLRGCEMYPSKNKKKIYDSIRQEFKNNQYKDPSSNFIQERIRIAYKGLEQLHQFDNRKLSNFQITLEQNPFPKPSSSEP